MYPLSCSFGSAHALGSQAENGNGRDEKDEVIELKAISEMQLLGNRVTYSLPRVLVLLCLGSSLHKQASQIRKVCLQLVSLGSNVIRNQLTIVNVVV